MNNNKHVDQENADNEEILLVYRFKFLFSKVRIILIFSLIGALLLGYTAITNRQTYKSSATMYYSVREVGETPLSAAEITTSKAQLPAIENVIRSQKILDPISADLSSKYSGLTAASISETISISAVGDSIFFTVSVTTNSARKSYDILSSIVSLAPGAITEAVGGYAEVTQDPGEAVAVSKNITRSFVIGAFFGFFISCVIYLFIGVIDKVLLDTDGLTRKYKGRIIAVTPKLSSVKAVKKLHADRNILNRIFKIPVKDIRNSEIDSSLILNDNTSEAIKDSYRTLRTNLLYIESDEKCKSMVFTSAHPGEGTTLSAVNTAVSLAQIGKKVLLIDADLRTPRIAGLLKIDAKKGLSEYLRGKSGEPEISDTKYENLYVLTSGESANDSNELLSSDKFDKMIAKLKEEYEYVIIDTSSVGSYSDAAVLSKSVTGYVIVTFAGLTREKSLDSALDRLNQVNANIIGYIMNGVNYK